MRKNFEKLDDVYYALIFRFSITCFLKNGLIMIDLVKTPFISCKNFNTVHQIKKSRKSGGLFIFSHEFLRCDIQKDLCINYDIESLAIETENKRSEEIILSLIYRQK